MLKCKKLEDVRNQDFSIPQKYLEEKSVDNARLAFRARSNMIKSIKGNFKNSFKDDLRCVKCSAETETQKHVLKCKGWEEQWRDLNTDMIKDQVIFFHRFELEKARMASEGRR